MEDFYSTDEMKSAPQTPQNLVSAINSNLQSLGIDWETFQQILSGEQTGNPKTDKRIQEAAFKVIKKQEIPKNLRDFRILIEKINDLFDFNLPVDALNVRSRRLLKDIGVIVFLSFVSYMVLGGIIEGQSALMKGNSIGALLVLFLTIMIIGALEGLQISVMALRLKDVSEETNYPRAINLHKIFRSAQSTNRFLAGRQLLVIVVVFFAAQLTSFPEMTKLPFTNVILPKNDFITVLHNIFLKLGVLGALFVLWYGQLVPQFLANNHPMFFLNILGMSIVLRATYLVEYLQLTRPTDLICRWLKLKKGPYIHISLGEKYRQEAEQVRGYGIIMQSKSWKIRPNKAQLCYKNICAIYRPNLDKLIDRSLSVRGISPKFRSSSKLIRNGVEVPAALETLVELEDDDRWRLFQIEISNLKGAFQPGDIIQTETKIDFSNLPNPCEEIDQISISRPTQYITFQASFIGKPYAIRNPQIQVFKQDEISPTNPRLLQDITLSVLENSKGIQYISWVKRYPELGTHYKFSWEVEYQSATTRKAKKGGAG